ncbi:restriction endonuclease subunit S [Staphylococcus delphini]|uniref:restriction endonuclease subunit S n=1 Tax=Staphylococcus delphini TaxID=53344 RepID=UPI000BBCBDB1|nr:restriction endonuclease subunit S [Staphylococcus delphini]PCF49623.1 hypothetical protein B5C09_00010 [Staphylococcus delphini]PCF76107.1 hypothetical protein B4W71_03915 [Staphylococcus delphini]
MTDLKKNVPELRFPEFEGEWEEKKLGDVLKAKSEGIKRGPFGGSLKKEIFIKKGYAVYEQQNAIYNTQNFRYFISSEKYEEMKGFRVKRNDIIMSCSGTIGKLSKIPFDFKEGIINQALIRFRTNELVDVNYFLIYMRSNYMQRKILSSNPGSAIVNLIPVKELKNLSFPIPKKTEQQKISDFFSKIDHQIALEEQKLALLEEQKKGYMQKIFSQELRFKDDNGNDYPEWEEKKLGELYKVVMGQSPKSVNYTDDSSYTVLVQGNADLNKGRIYPRIYTKEITKLVDKGNILLTVRAPVGEIGIAQFEACIGRGICSIEGDRFIYHFLEMFGIQNKWQKISQGSTFESISGSEVREIQVGLPSSSEREKISDFFSKLDQQIELQEQKIESLKQRKKGLLQKMFV